MAALALVVGIERYMNVGGATYSERALVLIDKAGVIRCVEVYDINKMPTYTKFEKALESLRE